MLYYQKSKPLLKMRILLQEFHPFITFLKITFHEVKRKNSNIFNFLISAFFNTIIQACYNLQLVQIFVRSCVKMSSSERGRLKVPVSAASPNVAEYLSKVVDCLEGTGLFTEVIIKLFYKLL